MKKIMLLMLLSSLIVSSSSVLAMNSAFNGHKLNEVTDPGERLNPYATAAKSLVSTAITLGTYAGMNIAFGKIDKIKSYDKRIMCKIAACFVGATISAANFAFLEKHFGKLWQLESGFIKNFCIGLMVPNILGSLINLASWVVFLGR
ncbi:MAG: hypothetical protein ACD_82C00017G0002 [uncultured bacterium]|nr:MAG: hypothetical protein ACD_82C00017G0002 [uncultured bacterium]KKP29389.1 MAG: hypothetical protein UR12_C0008G0016 [candidate division TM6 bacterium GW2011_GWF2_30_66]